MIPSKYIFFISMQINNYFEIYFSLFISKYILKRAKAGKLRKKQEPSESEFPTKNCQEKLKENKCEKWKIFTRFFLVENKPATTTTTTLLKDNSPWWLARVLRTLQIDLQVGFFIFEHRYFDKIFKNSSIKMLWNFPGKNYWSQVTKCRRSKYYENNLMY